MTATELVEQLQSLISIHGDLPLFVRTYESYADLEGVEAAPDGVDDKGRLVPYAEAPGPDEVPCILLVTD